MAHKVLEFVHRVMASVVISGDTVLDATAGNGWDAVRLARLVGATGQVLAFDVQAQAIRSTRRRVREAGWGRRVTLVRDSHSNLGAWAPADLGAVMFNLGYLPGGNREIITRVDSTLPALFEAARRLRRGGCIGVVLYRGHPGGADEAHAVLDWAARLNAPRWTVVCYGFSQRTGAPPEALVVRRRL